MGSLLERIFKRSKGKDGDILKELLARLENNEKNPQLTFEIARRYFELFEASKWKNRIYFEQATMYIKRAIEIDINAQSLFKIEILTSPESVMILYSTKHTDDHPILFDGFDFNSLLIEHLLDKLAMLEHKFIAIDFKNISYISDLGFGILLHPKEVLEEKGGDLLVFSPTTDVKFVLELIFEKTLRIYDDVSSLLESLSSD